MRSFASFLCLLFIPLAVVLNPVPAPAKNQYTPPGLYDVERIKLANGFQVLLKRRTQAHNVSIRLVVGLGTRHFDCDAIETRI